MRIDTKFFGSVDIEEKNVIDFTDGIPGFENLNKFVILDIDDNPNLK